LGDDGWTIIKLAEQLKEDRGHIKFLRGTIGTMYAAQQQQMVDHTGLEKKQSEPTSSQQTPRRWTSA
jgi:hypothetical protein